MRTLAVLALIIALGLCLPSLLVATLLMFKVAEAQAATPWWLVVWFGFAYGGFLVLAAFGAAILGAEEVQV